MTLAKSYRIETERLVIRCFDPKDAILLKKAIDKSLAHLLPWMPWAQNEPESLDTKIERLRKYRGQFDLGQDYSFGIFSKDEEILIGSSGLHTRVGKQAREIGYWVRVDQINKGYATETVSALTKVGFEIEQLERLEIHCSTDNLRSQNIPQKLGYQNEAILRKRVTVSNGKRVDKMIWTLFKEDYNNSKLKHFPLKAFDVMGEMIMLPKV